LECLALRPGDVGVSDDERHRDDTDAHEAVGRRGPLRLESRYAYGAGADGSERELEQPQDEARQDEDDEQENERGQFVDELLPERTQRIEQGASNTHAR